MITIDTKTFANLLGVTESELVKALASDGMLRGVQLPKPAKGYSGKTRRFYYDEAKQFHEKIGS